MLLSSSRSSPAPETLPLASAPLVRIPLSVPPAAVWIGRGIHGHLAREDYRLPELWCVHLYRWSGALRAGDVNLPIRPGYASVVPPNTPLSHYFRTADPPSIHLSFGFRLAKAGSEPSIATPLMRDTGAHFGALNALLEKAVGAFGAQPRRAEALLWEVLWRLVEQSSDALAASSDARLGGFDAAQPSVVSRTRESIELRLAEPLRVEDLAWAVELSHNHLTRLFHAATGKTVVGYIRERRVERATRLLLHTTMPIKQIAAQVGLPDLHQFNKAMRAATGQPPRALRASATDDLE